MIFNNILIEKTKTLKKNIQSMKIKVSEKQNL